MTEGNAPAAEPSWHTEFRAKYGQAALDQVKAEIAKAPPLSDAQVARLRRIFTANRARRDLEGRDD
ncbi:hypothetical protein [Knoellia koreensis]|uniref:Uncharacterized protein n=1 Tax=Knoellia koreensis TaxID=2730921 RepID=A0A849HD81_9MICO|nr:hypothetical protein [Knoellia sp. DB2414S]NNM44603.1 hypothetical protein [Knoellia sp. DB2414S]